MLPTGRSLFFGPSGEPPRQTWRTNLGVRKMETKVENGNENGNGGRNQDVENEKRAGEREKGKGYTRGDEEKSKSKKKTPLQLHASRGSPLDILELDASELIHGQPRKRLPTPSSSKRKSRNGRRHICTSPKAPRQSWRRLGDPQPSSVTLGPWPSTLPLFAGELTTRSSPRRLVDASGQPSFVEALVLHGDRTNGHLPSNAQRCRVPVDVCREIRLGNSI